MWPTCAALAALGGTLACGHSTEPPDEEGLFCQVDRSLYHEQSSDVDLLIVVDATVSMAALRDRLLANLERFARVLENLEGGLPSVHIAVTAADGTGALVTEPAQAGCAMPEGTFLVDEDLDWWICSDDPGQRCGDKNYSGPLTDALQCMGVPPADLAEPALAFASLRRALEGSHPTSSGFRRPNAFLAIVMITDGDDASPGAVADYAAFLHGLGDASLLVTVGAIAPPGSPRIEALLEEFPLRSTSVSHEEEDWSDVLSVLAQLLALIDDPSCLVEVDPTDVEPDMPGVQLDCAANEVDYETGAETAIRRCTMLGPERPHPDTDLPCWWVEDGWGDDCAFVVHLEDAQWSASRGNAEIHCVGTCGE